MKHIEQYRRLGTDSFKCNYSKQFVQCRGCFDERNVYEREALEWQKAHGEQIILAVQQMQGWLATANPGRWATARTGLLHSQGKVQNPSQAD